MEEFLIILALSIIILLIGFRLKIPPVVSLILTGVISGPRGFGLVANMNDVEILAEIGIILLLFGIGMEFSFKKLIKIRRLFLWGGALQVGLTILAGLLVGIMVKASWQESFFLGCLLSMSSTAIILRYFDQQGVSGSPHGSVAIAMLIFQDLIAIPILLLLPFIGDSGSESALDKTASLWLLLKGLVILTVVFFSAQRIVPKLLLLVARTRNKELFLISVIALCFGVAWLTSSLGLSLTIGAFLAGLIISESEYSNEAISNIFPFQALFISCFFISIGMLLDVHFVLERPFLILGLSVAILLLKTFTGALATLILGMPIRTAVLVGVALNQIGEFSFVIAKTGVSFGLASEYYYQLFLAVSLLTLFISPVLLNFSTQLADLVSSLPLPHKLKTGLRQQAGPENQGLESHIVIIGFGVSGKNLARSSKLAGIPYSILEMNPDTVEVQKRLGEPIQFGDATHLHVLEHVNVHRAKAVAVLINDPVAARRIVEVVRGLQQNVYIIVRARYLHEIAIFADLGADEVVPDEFGTSVEVFSRVLQQYHIPQDEVAGFIADIRAESYGKLREKLVLGESAGTKLSLSGIDLASLRINEYSFLSGKSLFESQLRKEYGVTVLLIRRGSQVLVNLLPETVFLANDLVVLVGERASSSEVKQLFGTNEWAVVRG